MYRIPQIFTAFWGKGHKIVKLRKQRTKAPFYSINVHLLGIRQQQLLSDDLLGFLGYNNNLRWNVDDEILISSVRISN